jgi:hypothetical protein
MDPFIDHELTENVLAQFAGTPDERLRQITASLIRHLHDFVRENQITLDEWRAGIDFLTKTGQKSDDKRQEFILLSDVLGVSVLVDAMNHGAERFLRHPGAGEAAEHARQVRHRRRRRLRVPHRPPGVISDSG